MDSFKQQLRETIAKASCKWCASQPTCKGVNRCGQFIPSAELYREVTRMADKTAGKVVK